MPSAVEGTREVTEWLLSWKKGKWKGRAGRVVFFCAAGRDGGRASESVVVVVAAVGHEADEDSVSVIMSTASLPVAMSQTRWRPREADTDGDEEKNRQSEAGQAMSTEVGSPSRRHWLAGGCCTTVVAAIERTVADAGPCAHARVLM